MKNQRLAGVDSSQSDEVGGGGGGDFGLAEFLIVHLIGDTSDKV